MWYTKVMNSPPGQEPINPRNPLVDIREDMNVTQDYLSEVAGMSRMAIVRYEQALYVSPSTDYLSALSELYTSHGPVGLTPEQLAGQYKEYRKRRIEATIKLFSTAEETHKWTQYVNSDDSFWEVHPFISFRKMLAIELGFPQSQIHFCMLTCFHPAQLDVFEKRRSGSSTIPRRLRDILLQADLPVGIIETEIAKYLKDD